MPREAHATRRSRDTTGAAEATRRSLCAAIFADPRRVTEVIEHEITSRFVIEPHRHDDVLQLDVIDGCTGDVTIGDRRVAIHGTTVLAAPPGVLHGYTLEPGIPPSQVRLVKLRVDRVKGWAPLLTGLAPIETLTESLAAFIGDWTPQGVGAASLARLARAICAWPASASEADAAADTKSDEADGAGARIRRVVHALGRRYHDPPSVDEFAEAAGLSTRHFARRFAAEFGCTPHEYLAARRLEVARSMLLQSDRPVADVADDMGFTSPAAFSRWFSRLDGRSPREFRRDPHAF